MTEYVQAPSGNHGGKIHDHKFIVMHYTATDLAAPAIAWLRTPASKASAHVVIDRDGTVTQLVPFDTIAWHAGHSQYKGYRELNLYSIGIELVNPGPVHHIRPGVYSGGQRPYAEKDVFHDPTGRAWALYTEDQLRAAAPVVLDVEAQFGACELTGHEFICDPPGRKLDPGPAFSWVHFRELCDGLRSTS